MSVKIVECPRDAMQGFHRFIPTEQKINYINALLKVGFDTLDCGSFVSPKSVPQLADTPEVLSNIQSAESKTKLLVIVANERGASEACKFNNIHTIGFPFSISEQFQLRNTNQNFKQALEMLKSIQSISHQGDKQLLVYLSMGFGNPYGENWSVDYAFEWCLKLADLGVTHINLSDTIGRAKVADIRDLFRMCLDKLPQIEFGAHFHTRPDNSLVNIAAAYESGCRKFDSAMKGFGGCPFADDKLTGNLPTEVLLSYLSQIGIETGIDKPFFDKSFEMAASVFS